MQDNKCNGCDHPHDHDHDLDLDYDYDDLDNIIELTGENGETLKVEFLATVKVDDQEYAVLQTLEDDDEDDEAEIVIMRLEFDDDADEYYLIAEEDEEVQQKVFEAFQKELMEGEEEDEDEDE
ncbi:hypothetical protein Cst_c20760 [Thermoclostridium stercorarium subsp. stercorarium DSM 8532]|jgi:hypothetical protein|uniref:Uncharacterized protein n=3 Tax=Thermoclostridium stercorarium TaxID=1510 RepID=L7VQU8_THES1|nr:DUF1292 domain-containing protein [Thermoclostridium stercorarium]AGC69049.1 hypothetical protein Cst_c20760 [Thermoclostridium stercorarium subsp. stercorarium DSM 8532]AGI40022.1 hypothetical protein Clst_1983 [Thermoclostridium stercorarium subsp. stercorarium DSM 8532]ANW99341.1 hypothetical protein CSTERTH_10010 [Thermoclostridium stercorarium subsp. thermolacticum DSM 2910]ANX01970.1 hypothetical protein CSTERLE_10500 [Thermoclostridium stercorarium subsp. leptospartum DSM 9219]UZQ850